MAPADEATLVPETDANAPQSSDDSQTSSDPLEKDWKEEYARLRKDYDAKASKLKQIESSVKSDEPTPVVEDETDFKIENASRIKLVKDEYKKELADLQATGAKLTPSLMDKALALAELKRGVTTSPDTLRQQMSASAPAMVNRDADSSDISLTENDVRLGVTPEIKAKWKHLVEGQG
jgi:hypothetical protein